MAEAVTQFRDHRAGSCGRGFGPGPAGADRRRAKRKAAWRRRRLVLLLMSPWIVGFCVFLLYPLGMNVYLSLTHYDLLNPPRWIGLANYRYAFTNDPDIWPAIEEHALDHRHRRAAPGALRLRDRGDGRPARGRASASSGRSSTCPR